MRNTEHPVRESFRLGNTLNFYQNCAKCKQVKALIVNVSQTKLERPLKRINLDTVEAERLSRLGKHGFVFLRIQSHNLDGCIATVKSLKYPSKQLK